MFCRHCGELIYDDTEVCPYCAKSTENHTTKKVNQVQGQEENSMAIIGFVSSLFPLIGIVLGLIFSSIALWRVKKYNAKGRGFAVAGLTIAGIPCAILLIWLFVDMYIR